MWFIHGRWRTYPLTVTSVLALQNSFDYIFEKGDGMEIKKCLWLVALVPMMALVSQAQIKHIEMRVEGMT